MNMDAKILNKIFLITSLLPIMSFHLVYYNLVLLCFLLTVTILKKIVNK